MHRIHQSQSKNTGEDNVKKMQSRLGSWAIVVGIFLVASFSWAQGPSSAIVVKATGRAFAPPLSQMVPVPPRSEHLSSFSDGDDDRLTMHRPRTTGPARDSVLQESADPALSGAMSTLSTNSGLNILGMGNGFAGYIEQAIVPDTNGAAGPTQFVQYINESFTVFNKSTGTVAYGPADGNTLFQALGGRCAALDNLDPIVQYDKQANRWVIMMPMFAGPFQLCVAVSTTSDATNGGWNLYAFPTTGVFPDYPKLAVWADGYYLTYDRGLSSGYGGSAACALDRNSMLAGAAATMQCFTPGTSYGAMLPADLDGTTPPPVGSPEYFLSFDYNDQSLNLWQFHVNWTTPASSTFTGPTNIPVAAFTEPCGETVTEMNYTTGACIPQEGTTQGLDSYGDRVMYRLAYRNFGSSASLVANHTVSTGASSSSNTGIRWYELRNAGSGFGLYQQGTYAPDSNYRWMGSIAMDKLGDIALGYSVSSSTMSPSIRYTGRVPSDPLGQMESEIDILSAAGVTSTSQTASDYRWGDYSSLAIDSTDDCTFWYTTEYQPANSNNNHWSTRIASFSFPACTTTTQNTLTVSEVGEGTVTSTDGKINCTNGSGTCSAVYTDGSSVTLNASAASGGTFSGWSGSCSGSNPCVMVLSNNLGPTATFTTPNYTLTVNQMGLGTVTSADRIINCVYGSGACNAVYQSGSSVALNATAASQGKFLGWSGACSGSNPCNLVVNSNLGPTATFTTPNYTLTVHEAGQGTVTSTDGKINCTNGSGTCSAVYTGGSSVSMNASPASGGTFSGWSGVCSGSNPCNVFMSNSFGPTATFSGSSSYNLTVNEVGQGTVTSTDGKINCTNGSGTCGAVYASGSSVTMNASPASGWTLSGWSGECSGGNPCKVIMNASYSPTATFTTGTTASWAIVNMASNFGSPLNSLTIPATGAGHLVAVALMFNGRTSVTSVSDNATGGSNTYVSAGARTTNGVNSTEIWYTVNSGSGATAVTPTFAGSPTHVETTAWEVSGISTSPPDVTNVASGTVTLNTPGPAVTTTQPGDFVLAVLFANSADFTTMSSGSQFTDDFATDGNGWAHITSNSASAGTYQASWYTASPIGVYCASTVAFLAAQ
jgi:hypothetical protein